MIFKDLTQTANNKLQFVPIKSLKIVHMQEIRQKVANNE